MVFVCLFTPLYLPKYEKNSPLQKKSSHKDYENVQAFSIAFQHLSLFLNTLNPTFKKLLISSYQAGVKLTNPPTLLVGTAYKATANVYQSEPDPERKGTKFSL